MKWPRSDHGHRRDTDRPADRACGRSSPGERAGRPGGRDQRPAGSADRTRVGSVRRGSRGPDAARALRRPSGRRTAGHSRLEGACRPQPVSGAQSRRSEPRTKRPRAVLGAPALGSHEVIVNAPDPVASLAELDRRAGGRCDRRLAGADAGPRRPRVRPPDRQRAPRGGCVAPHTHAQLYALDFVPAAVARERERFGAYATRTMGGNLLADLVQQEVRRRERIVAIDEETVLMAPYGARVPVSADDRAAHAAAPLRGRGAARRFDAPRGAALLARGSGRARR